MDESTTQKPLFNLEEFSKQSEKFYDQIKAKLEVDFKGKYAALDFESKEYWIGEIPSDALSKAKEKYPDKLFYLIQVGSPTTFSIQSMSSKVFLRKKYHDLRGNYR